MDSNRDQMIVDAGDEARQNGDGVQERKEPPSESLALEQSTEISSPKVANQKKPRGRPPGSGSASGPRNRGPTGRPRGRPRKQQNVPSASLATSPEPATIRKTRNAVFTSQKELDLEEGVTGVYIDPKGYENPESSRRQTGTCIAVFKSEKLKDPDWLVKNKGAWIEVSAERVANRLLEVEDAAAPRKRDAYNRVRKGDPRYESSLAKKNKARGRKSAPPSEPAKEATAQPLIQLGDAEDDSSDLVSRAAVIEEDPELQVQPVPATTLETFLPPIPRELRGDAEPPSFPAPETSIEPAGPIKSSATKSVEVVSSETRAREPTSIIPSRSSSPVAVLAFFATPNTNNIKLDSGPNELLSESESEIFRGAALMRQNFEATSHSYRSPFSSYGGSFQPYISPFSASSAPPQRQPLPTQRTPPVVQEQYPVPRQYLPAQGPSSSAPNYPAFQTPQYERPEGSRYVPPPQYGPPLMQTYPYGFPGDQFRRRPALPVPIVAPHLTSVPAMPHPPSQQPPPFHPMPRDYALQYPFPCQPQTGYPYGNQMHPSWAENHRDRSPKASMQHKPEQQGQDLRLDSHDLALNPASLSDPPNRFLPSATVHGQINGQSESRGTQLKQSNKSNEPLAVEQNDHVGSQSKTTSQLNEDTTKSLQKLAKSAKRRRTSTKAKVTASEDSILEIKNGPSLIPQELTTTALNAQAVNSIDSSRTAPASKKKKTQDLVDFQLDSRLASAEAIAIPEGRPRLACVFRNMAGNLILSPDLTILEFFSFDQHVPELPVFTLSIAKVLQNPITSIPGSKPMELRIKIQDDQSTEITYCFAFALTKQGSHAASNMRAKIVTAMIAVRFRAGETYNSPQVVEQEIVKPYECEKCGNRYLNINGLQYHQTKSATTCNPNWDPSTATPKKLARKPKIETSTPAARPIRESRTPAASFIEPASREDAEDSDASSEDSIIVWAIQNSTNGFGKQEKPDKPESRSTERTYKALNREGPILKELVREIAHANSSEKDNVEANRVVRASSNSNNEHVEVNEDTSGDRTIEAMEDVRDSINVQVQASKAMNSMEGTESNEIIQQPPLLPKSTVADSIAKELLVTYPSECLSETLCEDMIMAATRGYNNIFPSERSLWFACTAIWLKMHPKPHDLPKSTLISKALDNLLDDKKIFRTQFHFLYKKRLTTRSIVYIPGLENDPVRTNMLRTLVQESHPVVFVPSQFAPPPMVLSVLQDLSNFRAASKTFVEESDSVRSETVEGLSPSPYLYDIDSSQEEDLLAGNEFAVESESEADEFEGEESAAEDEFGGKLSKRSGSSRRRPKSAGKPLRTASHNAAIAESMRRKWDEIRAGGDNPFSRGRRTRFKQPGSQLNQQEKEEKRARQDALRQQSWSQATAFLPNPETGAWDVAPSKTRAIYERRQCLPEPITFMQDPSGAWSVRPFGHGVKPIHARPARRADGNPHFEEYLHRLQKHNGFRPVIYPTKNRLFLPSVPSKRLLRELSSQDDVPETTDSPKNDAPYLPESPKDDAPYVPDSPDNEPPRKRRRRAAGEMDNPDTTAIRISKATGKPVRRYDKRFQRRESTIESEIEQEVMELDEPVQIVGNSRYGTRKAAREAEIALLNFFEPPKLGPEAPLNPGLETVPPCFGLDASKYRGRLEQELEYENTYREISFRTPRDMDEEQSDPDYGSWTINYLKAPISADYNLRWDEQTAFTLETLPYSQIDDNPAPPTPIDAPSPIDLEVPASKRRRKAGTNCRPTTFAESKKHGFRRTLTALAIDFEGLLTAPEEATRVYGVQVAPPTGSSTKRKRAMGDMMTPAIEARFLVAVVVVVTLTGGLDSLIDWVLVGSMFPDFSIHFMKKHWIDLLKRKQEEAQRLTEDFQEAFPKAYDSGEVDPIDFDRLPDYNWGKLVKWTMKNVDKSSVVKDIRLPSSRQQLMQEFESKKNVEDPQGWRKFFYDQNAPTYRRIGVASAVSDSIPIPLPTKKLVSCEIDDLTVAKSWVRAIALTPQKDWNNKTAENKCKRLGKELMQRAMEALLDARVIINRSKGRSSPLRQYEVSDAFSAPLRKQVKGKDFIAAATFKNQLDEEFKSGKTCVRVSYFAEDGDIMAISSLQANGRIRLVPIGVPNNKFGLTNPGSYETRKIPPERMRFEMDIYPTEYYLYDEDNILLQRGLSTRPFQGSEKGEIPIWYTFSDKLIEDIWGKVLANVGQTLALRAGTNMEWLKRIFAPTMVEWELRLLMKWGEQVGFFEKVSGGVEGWTAGEWWWLVTGRSCVPEPEKKA